MPEEQGKKAKTPSETGGVLIFVALRLVTIRLTRAKIRQSPEWRVFWISASGAR